MIYRFDDIYGENARKALLKREEVQENLFTLLCVMIIEMQKNNLQWVLQLRL